MTVKPITHFIGFRGEEYWSAVRVWGPPHYVHMGLDRRARRDIDPGDTVVFANGAESWPTPDWNYPDTKEKLP